MKVQEENIFRKSGENFSFSCQTEKDTGLSHHSLLAQSFAQINYNH